MKQRKQLNGLNVILDRDGTIIKEKHYLSNPDEVELIPGVAGAMRLLVMSGARLLVVTNQSGIGRGYFSLNDYKACAARLTDLLAAEGVEIAHTTFCPHAPEDACNCRKPGPGMWEEIQNKFQILPEQTVMIGDKMDDVKFGLNNHFAASLLVLTGHGADTAEKCGFPLPCRKNENNACEVCNTDHLVKTLHAPGSMPRTATGPASGLIEPHAIAVNLAAAAAWITQNLRQGDSCA